MTSWQTTVFVPQAVKIEMTEMYDPTCKLLAKLLSHQHGKPATNTIPEL